MTALIALLTASIVSAVLSVSVVTVPTQPANGVWQRVAFCESRNEIHIYTPPYFGEYQILTSTWLAAGGAMYAPRADLASGVEQTTVAKRILRSGGPSQWPQCSIFAHLQVGD